MSYTCTVYATNSSIANTIVETYDDSDNLSARYTIAYDGDSNGHVLTILDSEVLVFSVEPAIGATFTEWVYRSALDNYDQQRTSQDIIFRYTNRVGILIHAEGTGGDWTASGVETMTGISSTQTRSGISVGIKQLRMIGMTFATSGTATFTGSPDLFAYISDSNQYSAANGVPSSILTSDTSGSQTFSMSYTVATGTSYYLWIRYKDATHSTTAEVTITPPGGGGSSGNWGTATAYIYNGSQWVQATPYIYNGSQWVQATPNINS